MATNEDQLENTLGWVLWRAPSFIRSAFMPADQPYQPAQIRVNLEA